MLSSGAMTPSAGLVQRFCDQSCDHLRGGPIVASRRVRVDLLCDGLVGMAEPVGDDLPVDAQVAGKRRIGMSLMWNFT